MSSYEQNKFNCRLWKNRQIAAGMCAHCFKREAGENGGTLRLCGECARKNRERASSKGKNLTRNQAAMRKRHGKSELLCDAGILSLYFRVNERNIPCAGHVLTLAEFWLGGTSAHICSVHAEIYTKRWPHPRWHLTAKITEALNKTRLREEHTEPYSVTEKRA